MLQNVRLLKWCYYYKIGVIWNLIWGFPGETEDDYHQELEVLKLITHLEPPRAVGRIWLERFSPYFSNREAFPIHEVRPEASYSYVYPPEVNLDKIAYFFDYQMKNTVGEHVHAGITEWVDSWSSRWHSASPDTLFYRRTLDAIFIDDRRGPERHTSYTFYGPLALIYEYCSEEPRTTSQMIEYLLSTSQEPSYPEQKVQEGLNKFCQAGLMLHEDGKYLSLAVPMNPNW